MASISIPLTQGKYALIDEDDFALVCRYKWCARRNPQNGKFYAVSNKGGKTVYMHRVIRGAPKGVEVDHIDGDGLNNTRRNLRDATPAQNHCNAPRRSRNTSGYKGVSWDKERARWAAEVRMGGRRIRCGRFATAEEAARAYDRSAKELQGEFAHLNFPNDRSNKEKESESEPTV